MGLFDFELSDTTPERQTLHDVSFDEGRTWKTELLTPTEVLQLRMDGYATRPHVRDRTIIFTPANSADPIMMTIPVPTDRDAEEYIDELLDGMLNEFLRYNSEWEFAETNRS